jgi:hypothetical protein
MKMAIKIDVQKSYEEVDIAGDLYILDINDDKIKEYTSAFDNFQKESEKLSKKELESISKAEIDEFSKKNQELIEKLVDLMLGEGSFVKIYHKTGKSLMVMTDILVQLMEVVTNKIEKFKSKGKAYYTGK